MTKSRRYDDRYWLAVEYADCILHTHFGVEESAIKHAYGINSRKADVYSSDNRVAAHVGRLEHGTLLRLLTEYPIVVHIPFLESKSEMSPGPEHFTCYFRNRSISQVKAWRPLPICPSSISENAKYSVERV